MPMKNTTVEASRSPAARRRPRHAWATPGPPSTATSNVFSMVDAANVSTLRFRSAASVEQAVNDRGHDRAEQCARTSQAVHDEANAVVRIRAAMLRAAEQLTGAGADEQADPPAVGHGDEWARDERCDDSDRDGDEEADHHDEGPPERAPPAGLLDDGNVRRDRRECLRDVLWPGTRAERAAAG